jgi:acetyltransferase-like isoleucine patch superfamily enzyme
VTRSLAQELLTHPGDLMRSLAISRRARSSRRMTLPIVASRSTRFELARGASIETDGRVVVDYQRFAGPDWFGELPAGPARIRMTARTSRLRLAPGVRIAGGTQLVVGPDATIQIGAGTFVNPNSRILCARSVTIGSRCAISWRVAIFDFIGGHPLTIEGRRLEDTAPIEIGDEVLIGAGATVLRGVTIGAGAVVAAASVVTRDVPSGVLIAGNPARVISTDVNWVSRA